MSLTHIRLNRIFNNDEIVVYQVESLDFSAKKNWAELGTLKILKTKKKYEFTNSQIAEDNKLIPPELYRLSEKERQEKLNNEYKEYGLGAWSICINHWANSFIENNNYPDKYPIF